MNENLIPTVRLYASQRGLEVAEKLGSGKDGIVMIGKHKARPADVAIKVLRMDEAYLREKGVYERLKNLGINSVLGFNVPELVDCDDALNVIEMTIVKRPFVLDFASAYLDVRPEFPDEVWLDWEAEKKEQFESRWASARRVLDAFECFRIYLVDVSPANIAFLES